MIGERSNEWIEKKIIPKVILENFSKNAKQGGNVLCYAKSNSNAQQLMMLCCHHTQVLYPTKLCMMTNMHNKGDGSKQLNAIGATIWM